jgi:hypothetical protein
MTAAAAGALLAALAPLAGDGHMVNTLAAMKPHRWVLSADGRSLFASDRDPGETGITFDGATIALVPQRQMVLDHEARATLEALRAVARALATLPQKGEDAGESREAEAWRAVAACLKPLAAARVALLLIGTPQPDLAILDLLHQSFRLMLARGSARAGALAEAGSAVLLGTLGDRFVPFGASAAMRQGAADA